MKGQRGSLWGCPRGPGLPVNLQEAGIPGVSAWLLPWVKEPDITLQKIRLQCGLHCPGRTRPLRSQPALLFAPFSPRSEVRTLLRLSLWAERPHPPCPCIRVRLPARGAGGLWSPGSLTLTLHAASGALNSSRAGFDLACPSFFRPLNPKKATDYRSTVHLS